MLIKRQIALLIFLSLLLTACNARYTPNSVPRVPTLSLEAPSGDSPRLAQK